MGACGYNELIDMNIGSTKLSNISSFPINLVLIWGTEMAASALVAKPVTPVSGVCHST